MSITSSDIKELRNKSGAGMMDCKKALDESNGNIEKAIEWLRKKGINTAQKKSSRSASDGLITIDIKNAEAVVIEVNSETDFVARNENFQNFCSVLSQTSLINKPKDVNELLNSNLLDSDKTVQESLTDLVSKLGENIVIRRVKYVNEPGLHFQQYLHNSINVNSGKIGVLLVYSAKENSDDVSQLSKNICMHIAATDPKSKNIDDLDKSLVEKERVIYSEQLKNSNKPDEILKKIIDGKIKKYYEEVCLMEQTFVMDSKTKIKDCVTSFNKEFNLDFNIVDYYIFKLGQE